MGLDPQALTPLTFNIGTGSIEKVSRIRDKYNLTESYTSKGKKEAKEYAKKTGKKMVSKPKKTGAKRGY